jgi:hypothetical protein
LQLFEEKKLERKYFYPSFKPDSSTGFPLLFDFLPNPQFKNIHPFYVEQLPLQIQGIHYSKQ